MDTLECSALCCCALVPLQVWTPWNVLLFVVVYWFRCRHGHFRMCLLFVVVYWLRCRYGHFRMCLLFVVVHWFRCRYGDFGMCLLFVVYYLFSELGII